MQLSTIEQQDVDEIQPRRVNRLFRNIRMNRLRSRRDLFRRVMRLRLELASDGRGLMPCQTCTPAG